MNRTVVVIPQAPPPSVNAQERMHWAARAKLREVWKALAAAYWMRAGRPRFRRPLVTVRLFYPDRRRRDPDNAVWAVKPLLDGLKGRAYRDDDHRTIALQVEILCDRRRPRVEIEMVERGHDTMHAVAEGAG